MAGTLEMRLPDGTVYDAFCIDLYSPISYGDQLVVNGPLSSDISDDVDWCAIQYILNTYATGILTPDEAAAIQATIWYFTTEPFGPYDGTGVYQFMTDPQTDLYDAYRSGPSIRDLAFTMINDVPRVAGECTFLYPKTLILEPETASTIVSGTVPMTGTVYDQNGDPISGVDVNIETDFGLVDGFSEISLISDGVGEVSFTYQAPPSGNHQSTIDAYVVGDYGTLLFDPDGNLQELTTLTLLPHSVGDNSIITYTEAGINVEKYVSVDDQVTWFYADEMPGPDVLEGTPVYFKFEIENTGIIELSSVTLGDSDFSFSTYTPITSESYAISVGNIVFVDPIEPGEVYVVIIGPVDALTLQQTNTATATGAFDGTVISDDDDANFFGVPAFKKSGTVFYDEDGDGEQGISEPGIPDVTVYLCPINPLDTAECEPWITYTDSNGYYEFLDIPAGFYDPDSSGLEIKDYYVCIPAETEGDDFNEVLYEYYDGVVTTEREFDVEYDVMHEMYCILFHSDSLGSDETGNDFGFDYSVTVGGTLLPSDSFILKNVYGVFYLVVIIMLMGSIYIKKY